MSTSQPPPTLLSSTPSNSSYITGVAVPTELCTTCSTNATVTASTEMAPTVVLDHGTVMIYVFVPVAILLFLVVIIALAIFLVKKNRIDKLRHHLMPLYSFDPAEEGEDWESELLGEGIRHGEGIYRPHGVNANPKLAFTPDIAAGQIA